MEKELYCIQVVLWEDFENDFPEKIEEKYVYYFTTDKGALRAIDLELKSNALWWESCDIVGSDRVTGYLFIAETDKNGKLIRGGDLVYSNDMKINKED